jgi:hypothetical protein
VPIDSDPDTPDRARQTPAAPDRQGSPDAQASPETTGSREPRDGPEAAAFRQEQIAEHARYQRIADAAYHAAGKQTWAEAVPGLRIAWEQYRERFPEQTRPAPRTQPDGGWVADGNRRLTPEQNAEVTKACADLRDEADQFILPAVLRVEAASPGGRLAGLDHMLKGEDRLKEKIAVALEAPGVTVREAIDLVPDAVRYTLTYDDAGRYADGVLADVEGLKAEGFELIKLKNLWHADQYKGVNSQWCRPDTGLRFEMQFHTPESLEAKELTHEAYERIRGQTTSSSEKLELEVFQRQVNALVGTPPSTDRIKEFPEQDDDRQSHLLRDDRRAHQPGKAANRAPARGVRRRSNRRVVLPELEMGTLPAALLGRARRHHVRLHGDS